jgi:DNA polymerase-3 subunit alpha
MTYTPLFLHNEYEFLHSANNTDQIISDVLKKGFKTLAIANHNHLYQSLETYLKIQNAGLKPVIGVLLNENLYFAKNLSGYMNLSNLVTEFNLNPDFSLPEKSTNEIIVLKREEFKNFGYFDIQYLNDQDFAVYDFLRKIDGEEPTFLKEHTLQDHFFYKNHLADDILKNNETLFNSIEFINFPLPKKNQFFLPDLGGIQKLRDLIKLKNNYSEDTYIDRLKYELYVIEKLNFANYFLLAYEIINFAEQNNIQLDSGRGSSAGSLVAFLLGITKIDPIKYNLLFERFLNVDRVKEPDIDIDLPSRKRNQIFRFLQNKFGFKNVSQIVTFTTFQVKNTIQDLQRVYKFDDQQKSLLISKIENSNNFTNKTRMTTEELDFYLKIISRVKNLPRNASSHAAGILISNLNLTNISSFSKKQNDVLPIFEIDNIIALKFGLVKIDLLALTTLDLIEEIKQQIFDNFHRKLNLEKINLDDLKVYQLLSSGKTKGIFQFEKGIAIDILKRSKPKNLDELSAINALNRPGANQFINQYIENKQKGEWNKTNTVIDSITKDTYGLILYQEQVMQIAQEFAGLTGSQSDIFRVAISSKNKEIFEKQKGIFVQSAINNKKQNYQVTNNIFNTIERFSKYGFNKSHAYVYAKLAYQMAYLKLYFPAYFYASALNIEKNDKYRLEIKQAGISLKVPDIKDAKIGYSVDAHDNKTILLGISSLKTISETTAKKVIEFQEKDNLVKMAEEFGQIFYDLIFAGFYDKYIKNYRSFFFDFETKKTKSDILMFITLNNNNHVDDDFQKARLEKEVLGFSITKIKKNEFKTDKNVIPIEFLSDFIGQLVEIVGRPIIKANSKKIDRNGREYLVFEIADETGKISAKMFSDNYKKYKNLLDENVTGYNDRGFKFTAKVDQYKGTNQVIINLISPQS